MEGPQQDPIENAPIELDFTEEHVQKLEETFPNGFGVAEENQVTKYVAEYFDSHPETTIDEAVAAYIGERNSLLEKGGYEAKDYSVTTGKQPGAGTVSMDTSPSEERAEID